ncbi:TonB system transport protein TonB [Serratia sp. S1B]|nr:TonB system transport protein TonB [Serratia sp. S1B]
MLLKRVFLIRRFSVSVTLSAAVHAVLVVALLYASAKEVIKLPQQQGIPPNVMMVNMAALPQPSASVVEAEPPIQAKSEPELQTKPEPVQPVPLANPKPAVEKIKPKPKVEKPITIKPEVKKAEAVAFQAIESHATTQSSEQALVKSTPVPGNHATESGPKALSLSKPIYPPRALALQIEGKVRVQYDIDSDGRVTNVRILSAEPRNQFEREVKQSMAKWRYEAKAAQNLTKTILFKIDGSTDLQ